MAEAVHVDVELPDVAPLRDAQVLPADDAAPGVGMGIGVRISCVIVRRQCC